MIVNPEKYTGTMYYVAQDDGRVSGVPISPFFSQPFEAKLWMHLWGDPGKDGMTLNQFL